MSRVIGAFLVVLMLVAASGAAIADTVGAVVRVVPGATLERSGAASRLAAGQDVASGDVIATDRRGQVQLLFSDQTRIAIGPNSRLVIDDIRLRQNGTARKFAVSAVAGGFRFLSGGSTKSAYAINTPTATMGIRGTAFDFVVRDRAGTDLVIFSGLVRMCGTTGTCFRVTGECNAVRMTAKGVATQVTRRAEKRDMVSDGFVFMTDQRRLPPDFRTNTRSCGRDVMVRPVQKAGERQAPEAPDAPDPPAPPEPPEPPEVPI